MSPLTRREVLSVLEEDWATYVKRFKHLSPEAQAAFLVEQGYGRLADLLAHFVAWWEVGCQSIERYLADPSTQPEDHDVDAFNAAAVARAARLEEEELVDSFERMRQHFVRFMQTLPETAFADERVTRQLEIELLGHLREHVLPG